MVTSSSSSSDSGVLTVTFLGVFEGVLAFLGVLALGVLALGVFGFLAAFDFLGVVTSSVSCDS